MQGTQAYYGAADLATLRFVGNQLFRSLFDGPEGSRTDVMLAETAGAQQQGGYINIALDLTDAASLAEIPWEATYIALTDRFPATDSTTNIIRVLRPPAPTHPPAPVTWPLKLLVVSANPAGDLDVEREISAIRKIVADLEKRAGRRRPPIVVPNVVRDATRDMMRAAIVDFEPHILHFIGHGSFRGGTGLIQLHKDGAEGEGEGEEIDTAALRQMLQNYRPWLVVLNSCNGAQANPINPFGGAAQGLLHLGVPFVVAMQYRISDGAAERFSRAFYRELADGRPVVQSVSKGRDEIANSEFATELATPVLYATGKLDSIAHHAPANRFMDAVRTGLGAVLGSIVAPVMDGLLPSRSIRAMPERPPVLASMAIIGLITIAAIGGSWWFDNAPLDAPVARERPLTKASDHPSIPRSGWTSVGEGDRAYEMPNIAFDPAGPTGSGPRRHHGNRVRPTGPGRAPANIPDDPIGPLPTVEGCRAGPYIVYFDWDQTRITPEAEQILLRVAATIVQCSGRIVKLSGNADRAGPAAYNLGLSGRRNRAVQAYLEWATALSLDIEPKAEGEYRPAVDTADGVRSKENRRVEILIDFGQEADPAIAACPTTPLPGDQAIEAPPRSDDVLDEPAPVSPDESSDPAPLDTPAEHGDASILPDIDRQLEDAACANAAIS